MSSSRFTVILRGEYRFSLSKAQIEHDSPETNFFSCCFLRDYREGASHMVELDQDPALFAIIIQHMSGYRILPLSPNSLPSGITHEVATENLARDAQFFGLDDLYRQLTLPALPPHFTSWDTFTGPIVDFEDVINGRLPSGIVYADRGLCSDIGAGVLRNVLVYGRNMRLELDWEWRSDIPDPRDPNNELEGFVYDVYLGLSPVQFQILKKQHQGWNNVHDTSGTEDRLRATTPYRQDVSLHINGRKALFTNLTLWLEHLHFSPEERVQKPRYQDIRVFNEAFPDTMLLAVYPDYEPKGKFHLWVDQAFFLIRPDPHGTPTFRLELLEVKARTRGAVLGASFPPVLLEGPIYPL